MVDRIHVVAGIIFSDDEQQVLLSKRHKDAHQGGLWEFPGGKVEPAESESQALARELREELNLVFANATPFHRLNFDYPDKSVELSFWSVYGVDHAKVTALEGQAWRWVDRDQLSQYNFPKANDIIVAMLS